MAATPKTGVIMFRGLSTGATFQKAIYNADVANTLCRIDVGAGTPGATGGADFCTFDEPVVLYDASVVTGTVDTLNMRILANYSPTSFIINWASSVNTLNQRPVFNIGFKAGTRISFQQIP
jgi:hypothetical protein